MSPFPVPIPYAERFTRAFADTLRTERALNHATRLIDLFLLANKATVKYFKDVRNHEIADEMALEFVVAGDYGLRLCAKPKMKGKK